MSTPRHCPGFEQFRNLKSFLCDCPNCGKEMSTQTSDQILDWIAQVAGKASGTADVVGNLVLALDHVLQLQRTFSGCGSERGPVDVRKLLQRGS